MRWICVIALAVAWLYEIAFLITRYSPFENAAIACVVVSMIALILYIKNMIVSRMRARHGS